jgi:hypothetical protein
MYTDNIIAPAPVAPLPEQPEPWPRRKVRRKREASPPAPAKRRPDEGSEPAGDRRDQVDRYV